MVNETRTKTTRAKRTSDTKNRALLEFRRYRILDLSVGLVIYGCCSERELLHQVNKRVTWYLWLRRG